MVRILDSTLREGEQSPGVAFPAHVRLAVAEALAAVGVDIIEAGHPVVTPEIRQSVALLAGAGLPTRIGAHARALAGDIDAALACGVDFLGIYFCVAPARLADQGLTLVQAVDRIAAAVARARAQRPGLLIRFTPEDAVRSPLRHVVIAAAEAVRAGADIVSIADTTGCLVPGTPRNMHDMVRRVRDGLTARDAHPLIAVHCHNDRGLALANALDGVRAGADIVDASVLGLGERAGIVDLGQLLAVLAGDFGGDGRWDLTRLPALYRLVSRAARRPVPAHFPVTGRYAFTHSAGGHVRAALVHNGHYASLSPELVGRRAEVALGHMSGLAAVRHGLDRIGVAADDDLTRNVLQAVKAAGQGGRAVDVEELALIVRCVAGADSVPTTPRPEAPECVMASIDS